MSFETPKIEGEKNSLIGGPFGGNPPRNPDVIAPNNPVHPSTEKHTPAVQTSAEQRAFLKNLLAKSKQREPGASHLNDEGSGTEDDDFGNATASGGKKQILFRNPTGGSLENEDNKDNVACPKDAVLEANLSSEEEENVVEEDDLGDGTSPIINQIRTNNSLTTVA